jgi:hypothetical protein
MQRSCDAWSERLPAKGPLSCTMRQWQLLYFAVLLLIVGCQPVLGADAQQFWAWFEKNQDRYYDFDEMDAGVEASFDELSGQLHAIHEHLTFEFGPRGEVREFIISADGFRSAIEQVQALADAAPKLPKWTIIRFRQPKSVARGVEYGGECLDLATARGKLFEDRGRIGILMLAEPGSFRDIEALTGSAYLTLDNLIGEYQVMTQAGEILIKPWDHGLYAHFRGESFPMTEFATRFQQAHAEVQGKQAPTQKP